MTKRTRLIVFFVCVACFFIVAPVLILYSTGERFDFSKMKITAIGGIYVNTNPKADEIIVDNKTIKKPGMLSNDVSFLNLLPKNHAVLIKKNGYVDYSKTLPVQEKQVTKLENVLLIKNKLTFNELADKLNQFSIAPNNQNIITATSDVKNINFNYYPINNPAQVQTFSIAKANLPAKSDVSGLKWSDDSNKLLIAVGTKTNISYYLFDSTLKKPIAVVLSYLNINTTRISFSPQDPQELLFIKSKTLYSEKNGKVLPIIKNVAAYKISGNNIIWLSTNGLLYSSDISGKLTGQFTTKSITIDSTQEPRIFIYSNKTFLQANNSLFLLNNNTKNLENILPVGAGYTVLASSDNKNLIYYNSNNIYLYSFANQKYTQLYSGKNITNCQWLNNDYIVFTAGNSVIISEIDYRGNINAVTLTQTADKIFFNQQDGKLYVLSNNTLLSSEKITQ